MDNNRFNPWAATFSNLQKLAIVCAIMISGCADKVGAPVDVNVAMQTLEAAMEGWKEGRVPDDLAGETPPITVQEPDWDAGTKLLDYQIVNDGDAAGPNLVAIVKLKLSKEGGEPVEKTATYIVNTSPKRTVYRNLMK